MMEIKGNMMSVREDVRVLDATLRDGGLVNDFYFTDDFVYDLYKANLAAGVDYMEFGQLLRDIGVDEKATLERFGGMSELLKKFILKFPEDPTYGRLVNVIENGVLEDVEREVHTLKGLTANLGISGLNQICSECLDYLRQRKTTLLPELYLRIQEEYDRVVELISEYHS